MRLSAEFLSSDSFRAAGFLAMTPTFRCVAVVYRVHVRRYRRVSAPSLVGWRPL
ncbi:hypothetical protein RHCRD62_50175 [Rhodococcus sp. RD6.2]|nr:hypothetical protein RHCRD62_50175 [Rhodococcus sp. RD6.2]